MIGARRRIVLLLVTALAAATPALGSAPAGAATGPTVSCRAAYPWITFGRAELIDGTVTPPAPGQPLRLQELVSNTWRDVKYARLDANSAFDIAVRPDVAGDYTYRVVWNNVPCSGATFTVRTLLYITIANFESINLGQAAHVKGFTTPPRPGQVVTLQQQDATAGTWHDVRSAKTDRESHYDIAVKPNAAGVYTYRTTLGSTASGDVTLPVFTWHYLADLVPVFEPSTYTTGTATINGTTYAHSVWWESDTAFPTTSAQYRMRLECRELQATVGPTDESADNTKIDLDLGKDTYTFPERELTVGPPVSLDLGTTYAYRLTVTATARTPDASVGYVALGSARIDCSW